MPSNGHPGVPGGERVTTWATFRFPRRAVSHTGAPGLRSAGGPADSRPRSVALLWPQLPDRSGNHGGGKGRGGLRDQDTGEVAESSVPGLCQDTSGSAGRLLENAGSLKMEASCGRKDWNS